MYKEKNTKINEEEENYIAIGMSLGMCFGAAIGSAIKKDHKNKNK